MNLLALPSTVRKGDTPHSIAASGARGSLPQPQ